MSAIRVDLSDSLYSTIPGVGYLQYTLTALVIGDDYMKVPHFNTGILQDSEIYWTNRGNVTLPI